MIYAGSQNLTSGIPMTRLFDRLATFHRRDHEWAEFWCGLGLFLWAVIDKTSGVPMSHVSYGPLLTVAPSWFWEDLTMIVAVTQMFAAVFNVRWLRACAACSVIGLTVAFIWNFIGSHMQPKGGIGPYVALLGLMLRPR